MWFSFLYLIFSKLEKDDIIKRKEAGRYLLMKQVDYIFHRRSIRSYLDRPLPDQELDLILTAGLSAPSANNSQPWEFIAVREPELLKELAELRQYWGMLEGAAAAVVVVANLKGYRASHLDFFQQDCSAATENMLLAADALGIGGVWLGLHPVQETQKQVREILEIPDDLIPFSIISLGYPKQEKPAHIDFNREKLHYDKY